MEANNTFDNKLNNHIKTLPLHKAPASSWKTIASDLDFSEELNKNTQKLPIHAAPSDVWDAIEQAIKTKKQQRIKPLFYAVSGIAAILIMGITLFVTPKTKSSEATISYSQETLYSDEIKENLNKNEPNTIEILEQHCMAIGDLCEKKEIKESIENIKEIELELENIENIIESIGSSPALIQTKIKMENLKVKLTKEVLHNLNS